MSDTHDKSGSTDASDAEKARTADLPDGSSADESEDTDRDTASGGPAK